jgi:hypothetical protein
MAKISLNYYFTDIYSFSSSYVGCNPGETCTNSNHPMIDSNYITNLNSGVNNIFPQGLDGIQISMPNNNSSESVMFLTQNEQHAYYTLNNLYLIQTPKGIANSSYSLVVSGNRNDYNNDVNNVVLIIIPIMNSITYILGGKNVESNNVSINNLISNMGDTYSMNLNLNNFFDISGGNPTINMYSLTPSMIHNINSPNYTIITLSASNIYSNNMNNLIATPDNPGYISNLNTIPRDFTNFAQMDLTSLQSTPIQLINNGGSVSVFSDQIYIDCQPTDINGEDKDLYMSKNLDNLRIGDIKNFNLWLFRFLTVFVIIFIVFLIVRMFGFKGSKGTSSVTPTG